MKVASSTQEHLLFRSARGLRDTGIKVSCANLGFKSIPVSNIFEIGLYVCTYYYFEVEVVPGSFYGQLCQRPSFNKQLTR